MLITIIEITKLAWFLVLKYTVCFLNCIMTSLTTDYRMYMSMYKPAWSCLAKQIVMFWGFKMATFCQQVIKLSGSYMRVFKVAQ